MDDNIIELLANKLKITSIDLKKYYTEVVEELSNIQSCSYQFLTGKNKGKLCGTLNKKSVIKSTDNKYYCKTHYASLEKKELKKNSITIVNNKTPSVFHSIDKIETEKLGDFDVIKDTLLIIDKSKNSCIGKCVNNVLMELDEQDKEKLDELNVDH